MTLDAELAARLAATAPRDPRPPQNLPPYFEYYPGKIIAIHGNHDSNPEEDPR